MAIDMTKTMRPAEIDIANKVNSIGTLLWSGNAAKGDTITVPNLSNYVLFGVKQVSNNPLLIAFCPSSRFRAATAAITSTPTGYIYTVQASKSGNDLKIEFSARQRISDGNVVEYNVEEIYGII